MQVVGLLFILAAMHQTVPSTGARHHSQTQVSSGQHGRRYRRVIRWTPLKGSHDALVRANLKANEEALERIQDNAQLMQMAQNRSLVELPIGQSLQVDAKLPEDRRYCRPWTASFLQQLGTDYYSAFKRPLQITSAVRTVEFQEHLRHHNGNAAPPDGDTASLHLTGATIDIAKAGMGRKQLKWARDYLLKLQNGGFVDVAEEFRQRVFHITVYRDYEAKVQPPSGLSVTLP